MTDQKPNNYERLYWGVSIAVMGVALLAVIGSFMEWIDQKAVFVTVVALYVYLVRTMKDLYPSFIRPGETQESFKTRTEYQLFLMKTIEVFVGFLAAIASSQIFK